MNKLPRLDVMLSSTSRDLPDHRRKAEDAAARSGFYVVKMENLTATAGTDAIDVSLAMVEEAEVYIGIFGMRYGFRPEDDRNPDDISITEMEYRHAVKLGMPILIFIMSEENHPPPDLSGLNAIEAQKIMQTFYESDPIGIQKLADFKDHLGNNHIVGFFDNEDDLRTKVLQALSASTLKDKATAYYESRQGAASSDTPPRKASDSQPSIPQPPELYAYPPYSGQDALFVGRREEMQMLDDWANNGKRYPMLIIEAIGGMGKSALTWKWAQGQHKKQTFNGIFWYSFYEGGAVMKDFVIRALQYFNQRNINDLNILDYEHLLNQLIGTLNNRRYLVILDGLERVLYGYKVLSKTNSQQTKLKANYSHRECVHPYDTKVLKQLASVKSSYILISSRLTPDALYDDDGVMLRNIFSHKLLGLSHKDAKYLWHERGIKWSNESKLFKFMDKFGRHSLLLKLLIDIITQNRRVNSSFDQWYDQYGKQINELNEINEIETKILQYAYNGLSNEGQRLLSQIASWEDTLKIEIIDAFNPFINLPPTEKIAELDKTLRDLEQRSLIWWDKENRQYDLHPIVRGYAASKLTDKDRIETRNKIYSLSVSQERELNTEYDRFSDMKHVVIMYNSLINAKQFDAAAELFSQKIGNSIIYKKLKMYRQAYELLLPMFPNGFNELPKISKPYLQSKILNFMASSLTHLLRFDDAYKTRSLEMKLDLMVGNYGFILSNIRNFFDILLYSNRITQALRCLYIAQIMINMLSIRSISLNSNKIKINTFSGNYKYNNQIYHELSTKDFDSTFNYVVSLIQEGTDSSFISKIINKDLQLTEPNSIQEKRLKSSVLGHLALRDKILSKAIINLEEAVGLGNLQDIHDPNDRRALVQAYVANRQIDEALRIIDGGLEDHGFATATVYLANKDYDKAREAALEFYHWSWAQGEPYVRRWELEQARKLLQELNEPEPQLPVWDDSMYEPFPSEAEVIKYIEETTGKKVEFKLPHHDNWDENEFLFYDKNPDEFEDDDDE